MNLHADNAREIETHGQLAGKIPKVLANEIWYVVDITAVGEASIDKYAQVPNTLVHSTCGTSERYVHYVGVLLYKKKPCRISNHAKEPRAPRLGAAGLCHWLAAS